jgi:UDP-N-acetylglucosamine acyltransferase
MIHHTAIIQQGAELAEDVEIGPYAVIGPKVKIGRGTKVGAHAVIEGWTSIGEDNRIFQMASVGSPPQDMKYQGETTRLIIGDRNTIREFVTINTGTVTGSGATSVGNDNFIMAYCHVGHDCLVGNGIIMANAATLAGHVVIGDFAVLGGLCAVHQFTRIGSLAMIGGGALVGRGIPPYTTVTSSGRRESVPRGLNLVGLRRRGFTEQQIRDLKNAYKIFAFSGLKLEECFARIRREVPLSPEVNHFVAFMEQSKRGVARPVARTKAAQPNCIDIDEHTGGKARERLAIAPVPLPATFQVAAAGYGLQ